MKEVKVRIPEDIAEKLEEIAKKRNSSISEIVREVIVRYMTGEQVDDVPVKVTPIKMTARRESKCSYCNEVIKPGEWIYYVIKEFEDGRVVKEAWHEDCWVYGSDRTLAKLYVDIRRLMRTRNALKRECDMYADLIIEAEARKRLLDIAEEIKKYVESLDLRLSQQLDLLRKYMLEVDASNIDLKAIGEELRKIYEESLTKYEEFRKRIDEASMFIVPKSRKRSRAREIEEVEDWRSKNV